MDDPVATRCFLLPANAEWYRSSGASYTKFTIGPKYCDGSYQPNCIFPNYRSEGGWFLALGPKSWTMAECQEVCQRTPKCHSYSVSSLLIAKM